MPKLRSVLCVYHTKQPPDFSADRRHAPYAEKLLVLLQRPSNDTSSVTATSKTLLLVFESTRSFSTATDSHARGATSSALYTSIRLTSQTKLTSLSRIAGNRKDSLKRHENICPLNLDRMGQPSHSYTTHDIPDRVSRQAPIRRSASLPIPTNSYAEQSSQHHYYNNVQAAPATYNFDPFSAQSLNWH